MAEIAHASRRRLPLSARGSFNIPRASRPSRAFEIERARFLRPVPLDEGFRAVEAHLAEYGRPLRGVVRL